MVNADLARALEELFGSTTDSDCTIVFYVESSPTQDRDDEERPAKKPRVDGSDSLLATPLPAHKLALRHVSERFRAQLERWQSDQEPGMFRVPLNSAAEVPAARAALKHVYTGRLEVGGVREAMEVRRQAAYLQILSCTAACDEYLKGLMQQMPADTGDGNPPPAWLTAGTGPGNTAGASTSELPQPPVPPVLELYACISLWPSPDEDSGGFRQGVLAATQPALVAHFKDTLATLNSPSLRQQLLELPAEALAALLESDDFGTDCEDSVLLLLATWMQANYSTTDGPTRERLCRLVRLAQLSRAYRTLVLPALAADHEMHPDEPIGWFPVGVMEAAFITQYAAIPETRENLATHIKPWDLQSPTYSLEPRAESSIDTHYWRVEGTDLTKALEDLEPDAEGKVAVKFNGLDLHSVVSRGFRWRLDVRFRQGAAAAGVRLKPSVPRQLIFGEDSRLKSHAGHKSAMLDLSGAVFVDGLDAEDTWFKEINLCKILLNMAWHNDNFLPLQQPTPASAGSDSGSSSDGDSHDGDSDCDGHDGDSHDGGAGIANSGGGSGSSASDHNGDGSEGNGGPLAAWSDYLQEGDRITGSLTLN